MSCIVCGCQKTIPLVDLPPQPLAALNLPTTSEMALSALRFPMGFHICPRCTHVYNVDFNYAKIPYAEDSNLMYNAGKRWSQHMEWLATRLKTWWGGGVAIDIGCGDGQFFSCLQNIIPSGKYIGFEPGIEADKIDAFPVIKDYFIPERDLKKYRPSLIVCRHVIEHLAAPCPFMEDLAFWCSRYSITPLFVGEVPCFNKALNEQRAADLLYEHVSNFTLTSFKSLFLRSSFSIQDLRLCYGGEVIVCVGVPNMTNTLSVLEKADKFLLGHKENVLGIVSKLSELNTQHQVVFWGGTGKGSAFMNTYGLEKSLFPFVVDSDPRKVGRFVPGTGQEIKSPESVINENSIIVITTAWRAKDIKLDIKKRGLKYKSIYVLQENQLHEHTS